MEEFWNAMTTLGKVYFIVALTASVVLVVQIIFLIIGFVGGGDADVGTDADIDGDGGSGIDGGEGASIFTIKGLVAFLAVGGWVGVAMDLSGVHIAVTVVVSVACGAVALLGVGFLLKSMYKLQSSGNISVANAVGLTGEVYLTVPANDGGTGKVSMILQERQVELDARTNCEKAIKTGSMVRVVRNVGNTVFVEPIEPAENDKNKNLNDTEVK